MTDPTITVSGQLARDIELRYTSSGKPVASGRVGHTPQRYDRDSGGYVDGETLWLSFSLWGKAAENLAASVGKGDRIIVTGRLKSRSFLQQGGDRRTVQEIEADDVGVSTKWSTARPERVEAARTPPAPPADDPWGSAPAEGGF